MKTVIEMAYKNAEQELRSCKGIYHPEDEEEMLDVLAVSIATGYEKAFEWIKYEDEVPPEDIECIIRLVKDRTRPRYYFGRVVGNDILFTDGAAMNIAIAKYHGIEWRLLELNQ